MSRIAFEKTETAVRFLNPLKNFEPESYSLEIRKDPLVGTTSVYNPNLRDKSKAFFGDNDPELLKKLIDESEKTCIFCGDKPEKNTPRYPSELFPEGRVKIGAAVLFANLFPIGTYHPVVTLGKAHFLRLPEFTAGIFSDGFRAAHAFLQTVAANDPEARFASVNMNYLFPAGASLVHPHLQMLVSPVAYSYHAQLAEAGKAYHQDNGSSYFADLIRYEKRESRYIAQEGRWHWMAAFSPMGSNEIMAIHEEQADAGMLSDDDLMDLSAGITKVLALYESLGHLSFNFTLYSVRGGKDEGFRLILKIINRQNLYPNYRNDDYFLQKMLHAELILHLPEDLAEMARQYF